MAAPKSEKQQADNGGLFGFLFSCVWQDDEKEDLEKPLMVPLDKDPKAKPGAGVATRSLAVQETIPFADEISPVMRAAYFVHDAMDGYVHLRPLPGKLNQASHAWHLATAPWAIFTASLYPLLTAFERPIWCIRRGDPTLCDSPDYPSYPMWYLDTTSSQTGMNKFVDAGLEACCLIPIIINTLLVAHAFGFKRRVTESPMYLVKLITLLFLFIDIGYAYATPPQWRAAPYLRIILFMTFSTKTCNTIVLMRKMIPSMVMLVVVLASYLTVFAWLGVLMFPKGDPDSEGTVWFNGLGGGLWSLIVLITTANFPDVMMPCYTENRAFVLFWLAFVIGGFFFLMNVVLAVVCNSFQAERDEMFQEQAKVRKNGLEQAFKLLDASNNEAPGYLTYDQMTEVFTELNRYHDVPQVDIAFHELFLRCLDTGKTKTITKDEFGKLFDVLSLHFKSIKRTPWFKRTFPKVADSGAYKCLEKFVSPTEEIGEKKDGKKIRREAPIDKIVDVALLLTFAISIAETWGSIKGDPMNFKKMDKMEKTLWEPLDLGFTAFFTIEALLKIVMLGDRYWIEIYNQFDAVVTAVTLFVSVIVYMPNAFNDPIWIKFILVFRVLRLLRLVDQVPSFQLLLKSLAHIYYDGRIAGICMALISVMYTFACLGMDLFGGMITTDKNSPYFTAVDATDFGGDSAYWPNNFNDLFSGMVTLFELLVVNNWFEIADGMAAAWDVKWPGSGHYSRIYFLAFYVVGVMLSLNVVVALIIDNWTKAWEETHLGGTKTLIDAGDGRMIVAYNSKSGIKPQLDHL